MLNELGPRAASAQPGCAFELVAEGENGGDTGIAGKEFSHQRGTIALLAAMQKDDMAGQAVGATGFGSAVEDGADGMKGLFIGEVTLAAHHALLEIPGAVGSAFHHGVVIRFEREDIDAAEAFDEGVGDVAQVGGETHAVIVAFDKKAVGSLRIVGEGKRGDVDVPDGFEVVIEAGDEFGERREPGAVFGGKLEGEIAHFGGIEEVLDASPGAKDPDTQLDDGLKPVPVEVVVVEVRQKDGREIFEAQSDPFPRPRSTCPSHALGGGARPETRIDEEIAPGGAHDGGISGGPAAEDTKFERHPCLQ